jgi:hypothetical protein
MLKYPIHLIIIVLFPRLSSTLSDWQGHRGCYLPVYADVCFSLEGAEGPSVAISRNQQTSDIRQHDAFAGGSVGAGVTPSDAKCYGGCLQKIDAL